MMERPADIEESSSVTDEDFIEGMMPLSLEKEIEELFSNNRVVGYYENEDSIDERPSFSEFSIEEIEAILKPYFSYFSPEEKDFIYLNLICGKSQTELAEFFGKTQPALCCDSNRIKEEISVVRKMKGARDEVFEFLSTEHTGLNYNERNVLLIFFTNMSITKTAIIMGINAMLCRSRIESTVKKLSELGHNKIFDYFSYVLGHLNKLKTNVSENIKNKKTQRWDYSSGYVSQSLF